MELWIPITIFAAFMQNARSAMQKHLKTRLSTWGSTFTRFSYGVPVALLYLCALLAFLDYSLPRATAPFAMYAMVGGLSQILATGLLVHLFSLRNFAAGTAFSKTETVQTAMFGLIVLGETVGLVALIAITISLIGVILLSITDFQGGWRSLLRQCVQPPALIGIAAGALFGVSAISYRGASLSLDGGDFVIRAAFTLVCVTIFQSAVMAIFIRLREPGQLRAVAREWRMASLVGLTGALGSAGWFTAMTLQNAAYVRALGQIELIFTFVAAVFIFRERITRVEVLGILLITFGILLLLLGQ